MKPENVLLRRLGRKSAIRLMVISPNKRTYRKNVELREREWAALDRERRLHRKVRREYELRCARQKGTIKGNRVVYRVGNEIISEPLNLSA